MILLGYDEAWLYAACCFDDGYSDWRIPTYDEANTTDKSILSMWLEENFHDMRQGQRYIDKHLQFYTMVIRNASKP